METIWEKKKRMRKNKLQRNSTSNDWTEQRKRSQTRPAWERAFYSRTEMTSLANDSFESNTNVKQKNERMKVESGVKWWKVITRVERKGANVTSKSFTKCPPVHWNGPGHLPLIAYTFHPNNKKIQNNKNAITITYLLFRCFFFFVNYVSSWRSAVMLIILAHIFFFFFLSFIDETVRNQMSCPNKACCQK